MKKSNKEANQSLAVKRKELGMLDKGTIACALIASSDYPDVLLPVKCVIEDAYFVELNLIYEIRIMMFFDQSPSFLLNHIRNLKFKTLKGSNSYRILKLTDGIRTIDQLNNYFNSKIKGTRFHVESCFVRKTKPEILHLFNRIQDYLIFKHFSVANDLMNRGIYSGKLKMKNEHEFKIRMERGFNSLFSSNEETKEYFDYMYKSNSTKRKKLDEAKGVNSERGDI